MRKHGLLIILSVHLGCADMNKPSEPTAAPVTQQPDGNAGDFKDLPKQISNFIGIKLVLIPPGKFMMGSPKDEKGRADDEGQRQVEINWSFYMGVFEVTQEEYTKVVGKNPSFYSATGTGKDQVAGMDTSRFPVDKVSWNDATAFCKKLSEMKAEKEAKRSYRLPTEAEWEYSCRGGAKQHTAFHFGNTLTSGQANCKTDYPGNTQLKEYQERTMAVGSFPANGFGLHDMHGNVWEWCADLRDPSQKIDPGLDPMGWGGSRVVRGGAFALEGKECRTAHRYSNSQGVDHIFSGFRVVCFVGK